MSKWIRRERISANDTFELWRRARLDGRGTVSGSPIYYVVHIRSGKYLHADGRLHTKREHYGSARFASNAMFRYFVLEEDGQCGT